jgi:hypothetical protein
LSEGLEAPPRSCKWLVIEIESSNLSTCLEREKDCNGSSWDHKKSGDGPRSRSPLNGLAIGETKDGPDVHHPKSLKQPQPAQQYANQADDECYLLHIVSLRNFRWRPTDILPETARRADGMDRCSHECCPIGLYRFCETPAPKAVMRPIVNLSRLGLNRRPEVENSASYEKCQCKPICVHHSCVPGVEWAGGLRQDQERDALPHKASTMPWPCRLQCSYIHAGPSVVAVSLGRRKVGL